MDPEPGTRRAERQDAEPAREAPHALPAPPDQGFLLLEVRALMQRAVEVAGVLRSPSQRRGHVLQGWPQHRGPSGQAPRAPGSGRRRCTPGGPSSSGSVAPPPGTWPFQGPEVRRKVSGVSQSPQPHSQQAEGEMTLSPEPLHRTGFQSWL